MFAVIKTGGKQYRIQEGDVLSVEKLNMDKSQKVTFDKVLLVEDEGKTLIGTPFVDKALVKAEIIENFKDKKIIVFKKKRRKQYKKKRGHRQELTRIKIEEIISELKVTPKKKPAGEAKKEKEDMAPKKQKIPREIKVKETEIKILKKEEEKYKIKKKPEIQGKARELKTEKPKGPTSSQKKTKAKATARTKKPTLKKEKKNGA